MVATGNQLTSTDFDRVRAAVGSLVDAHHLPGIAVGIVSGEDLVFAEGFGYADIEARQRQDPALRHRIGSITKTTTALCVMALVDEGELSLEDRIIDLLPDMAFQGDASALTIRHLMTHTGGIGEVPTADMLHSEDLGLWSDSAEPGSLADAYPNGIEIEVPPGTKWAYANHGWSLLGEIVARHEGVPVWEALRRRIFEPLGMADTDCLDQPHAGLTTGYHRVPDEDARELLARIGRTPPDEPTVDGHNIRGRYRYVPRRAAGAVQSTILDMARYASMLLAGGRGIVRPETLAAMVAPQWCPDERMISFGLGFQRRPMFGQRTFGHGGSITGGWNTQITVVPEENLAVLTHLNLQYDAFGDVADAVVKAVVGADDVSLEQRAVDSATLASAPGVYEATPGALTNYRTSTGYGRIQISARDGELVLHARRGAWKRGVRMVPATADDASLFVLDTGQPAPHLVALVRDGDGNVTGLRFDRLIEMVRTEQVAPWA